MLQWARWAARGERGEAVLDTCVCVDKAETSLARGEGRRITAYEEVAQLAEDVKRRGIARLAAENLR